MSDFTPGPWEVVRVNTRGRDESLWVYPVDSHGTGWVGDSYMSVHVPSGNGGESNAHLIAAAPELYEACEALISRVAGIRGIDMDAYAERELSAAIQALAKARGE